MTPRLPGAQWFGWIKNQTVRIGVLTGIYLSAVMVIALLAANRMPFLEPFAEIRNWAARIVFAFVLVVPILTFFRSPVRLIASGTLAWTLFALVYAAMGRWFFERLHDRFFTPFHLFMLGMAIYAVTAVAGWVASMAMEARENPVTSSRRRM